MIVCPFSNLSRYAAIIPGLEEAIEAVNQITDYTPRTIPLSNGNKILVQQGMTKPAEGQLSEVHRNYLDIQYIVKGKEVMGWADLADCKLEGEFNETKDVGKYSGSFEYMTINEGICYVVVPEDVHMPSRHLDVPNDFVKVVVKLAV